MKDPISLGCDCAVCPFAKNGRAARPVFGTIPTAPKGVFVVDAPSGDDVQNNALLTGSTGNEFANSLQAAALRRKDFAIVSATLCRPPIGADKTEIRIAVNACKGNIAAQLGALNTLPKFMMGNQAVHAVLRKRNVEKGRGFVRPEGIISYSPSYAYFSNPFAWAVFDGDIRRYARLIGGGIELGTERINTSPSAADVLDLVAKCGGMVAVDIETAPENNDEPWTGKDPTRARLKSIAFGTENEAVAIWWETASEAIKEAVSKVLLSVHTVKEFHNGAWFDIRVLSRYGMVVVNTSDTRDMRRALSSTSRLSLGYLGSVYCDVQDWKSLEEDEYGDEQK